MPPDDQDEIYEDLPPPAGTDPVAQIFGTTAQHRDRNLPVPSTGGEGPIDEHTPPPSPTKPVFTTETKLTPHEFNQRLIVYAVMGLLTVVVLTLCIAWLVNPDAELNTIGTVVLVPLIAFAGPIMGFYFGNKKGK